MEFQHLLELPTVKLAKHLAQCCSLPSNVSDVDAYVSTSHGILTNTQQFKLTNNGRRKIKETEGTYN